jgi:GNAT superfamily N-acetyltransferase
LIDLDDVRFRSACPTDAEAIASLHTDSWRRHYRGAYSDAFLDGDVVADRLSVWIGRLSDPLPEAYTIIAERDDVVVGFAHGILGEDPTWGALLDNLHVAHGLKRRGIGARLLTLIARVVVERTPSSGLYLWVLEQNTDAQAFYAARGGTCVGREFAQPPGGDPRRLNGAPVKLRFAWPYPSRILAGA